MTPLTSALLIPKPKATVATHIRAFPRINCKEYRYNCQSEVGRCCAEKKRFSNTVDLTFPCDFVLVLESIPP